MPAMAEHGSLTGTNVKTVTLTGGPRTVDVCNDGAAGAAKIYFTWAIGEAPANPTAAGDDTDFAAPGGMSTFETGFANSTASERPPVIIKLIGNGNAYMVVGKS